MPIRPFQPFDVQAVIDLWHRCDLVRPGNNPHDDIARKMAFQPDLFHVAEEGRKIVIEV